ARAVDFWEENASPERSNSAGKPAAVTTSPAPPPAPTPISPGLRTPSSPVQETQSAPKTSVSPVEIKSAPTPLPRITPLADVPAWDSEDPVEALAAELQGSENTLTSALPRSNRPIFVAARASNHSNLQSRKTRAHRKASLYWPSLGSLCWRLVSWVGRCYCGSTEARSRPRSFQIPPARPRRRCRQLRNRKRQSSPPPPR